MSEKPLVSFDYAIKYLLKDKGNHEIIEGFLSALLKSHGYKDVKIVGLLDSESNKEDEKSKRSLADLIVEDEDHKKYIVEIERNLKHTFLHKACFNTSRLIVDNLAQKVDYTQIIKVFHITLLYFPFGNTPIYHAKTTFQHAQGVDPIQVELFDKKNNQYYKLPDIFPEYFFISIPLFNDQLNQEMDDWLYVMKHDEVPPTKFHSSCMEKVAEKLSILKMTPKQRDDHFAYLKKVYSDRDEIEAAEEKGWTEGMEKGMEKGLEKGRDEGAIESQKKLIRMMHTNGMSKQEISKYTQIPVEKIEEFLI